MTELEALLAASATRLDTAATHLWAVLVAQARIAALTNLALSATFLAISALAFRHAYPRHKQSDGWALISTGSGLLTPIAALMLLAASADAVTAFLNPDYWAFKQLKP